MTMQTITTFSLSNFVHQLVSWNNLKQLHGMCRTALLSAWPIKWKSSGDKNRRKKKLFNSIYTKEENIKMRTNAAVNWHLHIFFSSFYLPSTYERWTTTKITINLLHKLHWFAGVPVVSAVRCYFFCAFDGLLCSQFALFHLINMRMAFICISTTFFSWDFDCMSPTKTI